MQTTGILVPASDSGLHVLHCAIFVLICLESAISDAFLRHSAFLQYTAASLFIFLIFRMKLLPLSLFIVFDHRHLGRKQQVNKIKQQLIINDNYGHELWLCVILLY